MKLGAMPVSLIAFTASRYQPFVTEVKTVFKQSLKV
ncbi:MAG: hypothetical protein ACI8XC_002589 [Gammaproteobacteria bacterium]|jgi:hypothetical protein